MKIPKISIRERQVKFVVAWLVVTLIGIALPPDAHNVANILLWILVTMVWSVVLYLERDLDQQIAELRTYEKLMVELEKIQKQEQNAKESKKDAAE